MKSGAGSKRKGSSFERVVAKMVIAAGASLSLTKQDCYRTPLSGGHPTAGAIHPSDLVISDRLLEVFPFSVECKHYKRIELQQLWTGKGKIFKWVDQAIKASKPTRPPLVVMKWNLSPIFCAHPIGAVSYVTSRAATGTELAFRHKGQLWAFVLFSDCLKVLFEKHRLRSLQEATLRKRYGGSS